MPKEIVLASHSANTFNAYSAIFSVKGDHVVGMNPEPIMKEPESDTPELPALAKLSAVERMIAQSSLHSAPIISADVVFKKDGTVFHRSQKLRDTLAGQYHAADGNLDSQELADQLGSDALDFFLSTYSTSPFLGEWWASFGYSYVPKKKTESRERYRVITSPIKITAEMPRLKEKYIKNNLTPKSPTGVNLLDYAIRKDIPLMAQTEGSDKRYQLSPKMAEQIIIYRALHDKKMVKSVKKERSGAVMSQFFQELEADFPFQTAYMNNILRDWVHATRAA